MANGQQKAQKNVDAFRAWAATKTDDDFKQIAHRGQLNRGEVAKAIGIGKSSLRQNPVIKEQLEALENELRQRGVLPPPNGNTYSQKEKPKRYDQQASRSIEDNRRLSQLEQQNIELKAKVAALESKLKRFGELSEILSDFGVAPE
jgi:hypothetical protein